MGILNDIITGYFETYGSQNILRLLIFIGIFIYSLEVKNSSI